MNKLLQVRLGFQRWISENQNSPDVPRVQKVIEYLAQLAQSPEGTEFGKELLVRWALGEFDAEEASHDH